MTIKKDLKWLNIHSFGLDWHTDRHIIRISKIFKANPGWNIAFDWKAVDFWTMIGMILMAGRIWASLILINVVIWSLVWFLQNSEFLDDFQPCDSYIKNSYKKETMYSLLFRIFFCRVFEVQSVVAWNLYWLSVDSNGI